MLQAVLMESVSVVKRRNLEGMLKEGVEIVQAVRDYGSPLTRLVSSMTFHVKFSNVLTVSSCICKWHLGRMQQESKAQAR